MDGVNRLSHVTESSDIVEVGARASESNSHRMSGVRRSICEDGAELAVFGDIELEVAEDGAGVGGSDVEEQVAVKVALPISAASYEESIPRNASSPKATLELD